MNKKFYVVIACSMVVAGLLPFFAYNNKQKVDFIIFSYDRPMQLYALLESTKKHVVGVNSITVIYRTSSSEFDRGYDLCFSLCKNMSLILCKQSSLPTYDFKPLLIRAVENAPANYIMFGVDDIIVRNPVKVNECIHLMEKYDAYGFYLRLGINERFSWAKGQNESRIPYYSVVPGVYKWMFMTGKGDWGYPNTVDMTIYRKKDVVDIVKTLPYHNPNTFEGYWDMKADKTRYGLFFEDSKIVNIPLNRVQTTYQNYAMNTYLPEQLLKNFFDGYKINIDVYHNIKTTGAHMLYFPDDIFIKR